MTQRLLAACILAGFILATGCAMAQGGDTTSSVRQGESATSPAEMQHSILFCDWEATASTHILEPGRRFLPAYTIDGRLATAWSEGVPGPGIGQTVTFAYRGCKRPHARVVIRGITVQNGLARDEEAFANNNRVQVLRIQHNGNSLGRLMLKDSRDHQTFRFRRDVEMEPGDKIVATILAVYKGARFDDTCLTELHPLGSCVENGQ